MTSTPQEIKAGMTKGEWSINEKDILDDSVYDTNGKMICSVTGEETTTNEDVLNQIAICLAVNNTFGQNINPEKVPDMVKMLNKILVNNSLHKDTQNEIITLLTSAKL